MKNTRSSRDNNDSALSGLVSWVSGKDSVKHGTSPLDGAVGELLSWVTGKGGTKDKTVG